MLAVAVSTVGVAFSLSTGWTSVVLPFLPRALLAGTAVSLFEASTSALRSFSDFLVSSSETLLSCFFNNASTEEMVSFTSVNCWFTCSCVASLSPSSFLASTTTVLNFPFSSSSFTFVNLLSNSAKAVCKSVTFTEEVLMTLFTKVSWFTSFNGVEFPVSFSTCRSEITEACVDTSAGLFISLVFSGLPLVPDESPPLFIVASNWWALGLAVAGVTTSAAATPPPLAKNINAAMATLAAPKWYLRIE